MLDAGGIAAEHGFVEHSKTRSVRDRQCDVYDGELSQGAQDIWRSAAAFYGSTKSWQVKGGSEYRVAALCPSLNAQDHNTVTFLRFLLSPSFFLCSSTWSFLLFLPATI